MLFTVLLSLLSFCQGANILVMVPLSPKSHVFAFKPVFDKLVEKGHNITIVTNLDSMKSRANFTVVNFKGKMETFAKKEMEKLTKGTDKMLKDPMSVDKHALFSLFQGLCLQFYEQLLMDGTFLELIDESAEYDLMISESHYLQELFIVFSHFYRCPTVVIESHFPSVWSCFLTGNICPSFQVPNYKSSFTDSMTFEQGVANAILNMKELLHNYFRYIPEQDKLVRKYLKHPSFSDLPPLIKLVKNVSLILVDSHFSQAYPRAFRPNVVEVGGLSIGVNETLDEELDRYMKESVNGVIYFTFGSTFPLKYLPKKILNAFLDAFRDIKQDVLMKWDDDLEIPNKPKNVKLLNWAPQNSILAHEKCVLFISHAGVHSLTEAIYHGVPLLLIPLFSDQDFNSKFAEFNGFAHIIDKENISRENVLKGIQEVISNPRYKENVLKRSSIYKDRPLSALDTAVYWIEYVLRHKGAYHLQPSTAHMSIYQYIMLDIGHHLLVFCTLIGLFTYFFIQIIFKIIRK